MLPSKTHFSPLTVLPREQLGYVAREPRLSEYSFHDIIPAHISASGVTLREFMKLCGDEYLNLGLTPKSVRHLYRVVSGKRSWNLDEGRSILGLCRHAMSLEYGTKYDITDQVRPIPYLCLSVEASSLGDRCRLGKGELYLLRTNEGVNLELSLDPSGFRRNGGAADSFAKQWTPFSLVGNAFGINETLVEEVFEARENATYRQSEHIDSWAVSVTPRVSVTVVHGVSAPKIVREQAQKILVPTSVQLANVQKLNVKEWEKALLREMDLPAYVPSETGGILRCMRDFCARQSEYDGDVLSSLRAATVRGGSVELHAYEFCSNAEVVYRAAELSTTNSMIKARIQADCDDLGWKEPRAHFEWDVPSFVTAAFVKECKASCKAVMRPFVSEATLEAIDTMRLKVMEDPRKLTFGEVRIAHGQRNLVEVPTFDLEV